MDRRTDGKMQVNINGNGIKTKRAVCFFLTSVLLVAAFYMFISVRNTKVHNVDLTAVRQTQEDEGEGLLLRGLSLRKGIYGIDIGYLAGEGAAVEISLDNETYRYEELPETDGDIAVRNYTFTLKTGTDRGRIDFHHPAEADLKLAYITITSDRPIYYDGIIWGVLLLLLIPFVWTGYDRIMNSRHKIPILIMLGIAAVEILPFILQPGLHLGTDTRGQMMRIEGVYYGLMDGQFPVVVYPEWNNSYGQAGVLYPNLFLYIPAFFRLLGMSQLGTCKLFIFIIITASALIAYFCAKTVFETDGAVRDELKISLTVLLLGFDNMRLINMLDDGRLGGALIAEMFYPLVIAGLINVFYGNRKKWYFLAYGLAGIFCCHIMSATLICLAVLLFVICCARRITQSGLPGAAGKAATLFGLLVLGSMSLFLKFFFGDWGQDKLQWEDFLSTLFSARGSAEDIKWVYVIVLAAISACLLVFITVTRRRGGIRGTFVIPVLVCAYILFWMSTAAFPWEMLRRIDAVRYYTDMVQNAYRFLSLSNAMMAFSIPVLLEAASAEKEGGKNRIVICVGAVLAAVCIFNYVSANNVFFRKNQTMLYYDEVTGEMESQVDDYLPAGTDPAWYESDTGYISDEEAVSSLGYEREGTCVYYSYTNSSDGAYVEFPRFFYEGYTAGDENGAAVDVVKGDRNRTRVYLKVTDEPASIKMWYRPALWMSLTMTVSFICWIGTGLLLIVLWFWPHSGILRLWK